mgnify:CR=1 FL=1
MASDNLVPTAQSFFDWQTLCFNFVEPAQAESNKKILQPILDQDD